MRRLFNLVALAAFCLAFTSANYALAGHGGGHGHSGGQSGSSFKSAPHSVTRNLNLQPKNKVITGTKNGMGYIADPAKRHLSPSGAKVTKIMDPIRPKHGAPTITGGGQITTATTIETNLLGIKPGPTGTGPIVRDHTIPKPTVKTNPYSNPPTVTGSSGLEFANPLSFTAPAQPRKGIVDHRTQGYYSGNGPSGYTVNTQGPANTIKTPIVTQPSSNAPPPRTGGK